MSHGVRNNKKNRRALRELNGGTKTYTTFDGNNTPICPYCGKRMRLVDATEYNIHAKEGQKMLVCQDINNGCDVRANLKVLSNGKYQLISNPANARLRKMREEAHYYMERIVRYNILSSTGDVYGYLNNALTVGTGMREYGRTQIGDSNIGSYGTGRVVHVGFCNEYICQQIVSICVKLLYDNREKLKYNLIRYEGSVCETPEISALLDQFAKRIKKVNK